MEVQINVIQIELYIIFVALFLKGRHWAMRECLTVNVMIVVS